MNLNFVRRSIKAEVRMKMYAFADHLIEKQDNERALKRMRLFERLRVTH